MRVLTLLKINITTNVPFSFSLSARLCINPVILADLLRLIDNRCFFLREGPCSESVQKVSVQSLCQGINKYSETSLNAHLPTTANSNSPNIFQYK